ncbi:hypothetical protein SRA_00862 [Streptococcus ratti FA-1 = DSM 20564]|uniref:Transposase n=1 Tax=Streptococcus ratti FA-1 = DSM 20564 TaxID=699248 RepID=A0ABN0GWJ1_STRRT|nr:hypothetical protein SRA_00862 [Streptococcus ratti FA-1 = DSM 20564]
MIFLEPKFKRELISMVKKGSSQLVKYEQPKSQVNLNYDLIMSSLTSLA